MAKPSITERRCARCKNLQTTKNFTPIHREGRNPSFSSFCRQCVRERWRETHPAKIYPIAPDLPGEIWKTCIENDSCSVSNLGRVGRDNTGSRNGRAKLTEDSVRQIVHLLKTTNLTHLQIASQFNVSDGIVQAINRGRRWKKLLEEEGIKTFPIQRVKQR